MGKKSIRIVNGYRVIYEPSSHRAMTSEGWNGYVYEHIVIAEKYAGRWLEENEVVHHLDGNRSNNRATNLLILDRGQHTKLHNWINAGARGIENHINLEADKVTPPTLCAICGSMLQGEQEKYCSRECQEIGRRKVEWPTKETLKNDLEDNSFCGVGRKYGVSDNSIRKWIKHYDL